MALGLNIKAFKEILENKLSKDCVRFVKRISPLNVFMTSIENITNDVWNTMFPDEDESFDESGWGFDINIDSCVTMLIEMEVYPNNINIWLNLDHMDEPIIDNVKCYIVGDKLACDEKLDISDNERLKATMDPEVFEALQKVLNTIEVK